MEWPGVGDWIAVVAFIVTISFIAAIIETWWEERKR